MAAGWTPGLFHVSYSCLDESNGHLKHRLPSHLPSIMDRAEFASTPLGGHTDQRFRLPHGKHTLIQPGLRIPTHL
jgi:hypothetical protein